MKAALILLLGALVAGAQCQSLEVAKPAFESCSQDTDCRVGNCCYYGHMIASKRALFAGSGSGAYCKPVSKKGELCGMFNSCGCECGTSCQLVEEDDSLPMQKGKRKMAYNPGTYKCL